MAETVSLGILSLPSVLATVGLVPGIILICVISALATYSGLLLAEFRKQYPFVQNFGDAVGLLGRSIGMGGVFREVFGWAQTVVQVFLLGGHILMWTICMNTLTNSTVCTVAWAAIGMFVFSLFNIPRTLKYTSWMSAACEFRLTDQSWPTMYVAQPLTFVKPASLYWSLSSSPSLMSGSRNLLGVVPSKWSSPSASHQLSLL